MALTGPNFVRFTRHGLQSIRSYWSHIGDRFEVRRQALKLRFWDERHEHGPGMLFDHTYESIKRLDGLGIYELRLFFGPGYRVYFGEHRGILILLLSGGDKSTQKKDIKAAKEFWKIYMEDNV